MQTTKNDGTEGAKDTVDAAKTCELRSKSGVKTGPAEG